MMLQQTTRSCLPASTSGSRAAFVPHRRPVQRLVVRAAQSDDASTTQSEAGFEDRIASLRRAKGMTPRGEGAKKAAVEKKSGGGSKKEYDYTEEKVFFESSPSLGDLAVNVGLGITLLWLPLTFAAIGRVAFVKYRFTDRRVSIISSAPWETSQVDAAYEEVTDVKAIGRGVGAWGDMVIELRSGNKLEMRAVPRWQEMRDYVMERAKAARQDSDEGNSSGGKMGKKGFA